MNLDAYDDMMGLEFGEYEGLGAIFDPEILKSALIASTAGGSAILLTTWGVKQVTSKIGLDKIANPLLKAAATSGLVLLAGLAAGRGLMRYNMNAGIGVVGGLGGIALANFLDAALSQMTGSARILAGLGEDSYGMSGGDDGMAALAALEATGVQSAPGAFGLADSTVTPEHLMGFEAAVTQSESLGGYAPYLA